jgi:hypothetical protein
VAPAKKATFVTAPLSTVAVAFMVRFAGAEKTAPSAGPDVVTEGMGKAPRQDERRDWQPVRFLRMKRIKFHF